MERESDGGCEPLTDLVRALWSDVETVDEDDRHLRVLELVDFLGHVRLAEDHCDLVLLRDPGNLGAETGFGDGGAHRATPDGVLFFLGC